MALKAILAGAIKPTAEPSPAPTAAPMANFLAGLTRVNCAAGCNEQQGCVISQRPRCSHPCKGGLDVSQQHDLAALERLQAAKRQLAMPNGGIAVTVNEIAGPL